MADQSANELTLEVLRDAVASAAAFRSRRRLQPAGGEGDKVFPPTFAGAVYAIEQRRVPGRAESVQCVLLDSVQSQANRMEQALQDAVDAQTLKIPVIEVDFTGHDPPDDVDADKAGGKLVDGIGKVTACRCRTAWRTPSCATATWCRRRTAKRSASPSGSRRSARLSTR